MEALVALESTVFAHGLPRPQNLETAFRIEEIVRDQLAAPRTIGIVRGRIQVGLNEDEIRHLAGAPIQDLVISVAGAQVAPIDRHGQVSLDARHEITHLDVERAIGAAQEDDPEGLKTIHRVVQGFAVNGDRTQTPLGRIGNDLADVWRPGLHQRAAQPRRHPDLHL